MSLALFGYGSYARRIRDPVDKPGLPLRQFVFYYFNGREACWKNWAQSFMKMPDRRYLKVRGEFLGFVLVVSIILASVFAIAHNTLIFVDAQAYSEFVRIHGDVYLPVVLVLCVTLSANLFFLLEFNTYRTH
ncbi:MAG: hypothetical protein OEW08_00200 [Gammaproteobacteria bacterium]|nr:hypothetical protein [Gammaproteobacteria bacterium]